MKTKMTKVLSLMVVMALILGTMPMVFAADEDTSLKTAAGTIQEFKFESQGALTYATDHAYAGARSLKITTDGNNTFVLPASQYFNGGTYNFEFYMYPKTVDGNINLRMGWAAGCNTQIMTGGTMKTGRLNETTEVEAVTGAAVGDGTWYKVTGNGYTAENQAACGLISLFGCTNAAEVYIDNLKITRTDGGILFNNPSGDFEVFTAGTGAFSTNVGGLTAKNTGGSIVRNADAYGNGYVLDVVEKGNTNALYVNTMDMRKLGKKEMYIGTRANFGMNTAAGNMDTYRFEFYMLPLQWTDGGNIWVSISANNRGYMRNSGISNVYFTNANYTLTKVTEGEKAGWYKVTSVNTVGIGSWDPNMFIIETGLEMYLDDLTVYQINGSTEKLLKKFDFEPTYDLAKNMIAAQVDSDKVSVSWRNPKAPAAQQIKLYDVSNGTDVLLADNFATTAGGLNEYLDATATAGTNKVYRVDFIYADGAVKSQTAGTTVATGAGWVYDAAKWHLGTSASPKQSIRMNIDDKVYHTAAPSIHVASNKNGFGSGPVLTLTLDDTIPAGTYQVSFYRKVVNAEYIWTYAFGINQTANRLYPTGTWGAGKLNNGDWDLISREITIAEATTKPVITLDFQGVCEDFWIDDVALYKVENGATVGENLVAAIGTVSDVAAAPAAPTAVAADTEGVYNEATLTWTVGEDAKYLAIYNKGAEDIPVAYIPTNCHYVDMKNLTGGKAYTYTVKTVNAEGRESASGFDVTVIPNAKPLVIGEFATSKTGDNVTVSVDVKNNGEGSGVTAQLILATYYNDTLQSFKATNVTTIPETAVSAAPITLSETITVPSGYTMVMYLWDSLKGMRPLKQSKTY